jgi:hypothetical protein
MLSKNELANDPVCESAALLEGWRHGDRAALQRLLPLVYAELSTPVPVNGVGGWSSEGLEWRFRVAPL